MDAHTVLNSDNSQEEDVVNSFEAGKDVSDPMEEDIQSLDVIIDLKKESSIRKHLIKHTREGSQNYKICNKVFKNRSSLRKHLIKHTDGGSRNCKVCNKAFKNRYSLKIHKRTHQGEKCFKCDYKAVQLGKLKRHLQSHSKSSYKCPHCSYIS